jgi:hypothetical protein
MLGAKDDDFAGLRSDLVYDAVLASSCGVEADELPYKRVADTVGVGGEAVGEELDHGGAHLVGQRVE